MLPIFTTAYKNTQVFCDITKTNTQVQLTGNEPNNKGYPTSSDYFIVYINLQGARVFK